MRSVALARFFVAGLCLVLSGAAFSQRTRTRFDANWKFHREPLPLPGRNEIATWQWHSVAGIPNTDSPKIGLTGNQQWQTAPAGADVFHGRRGFAWFETRLLKAIPPLTHGRTVLHFDSVDDNATVYINGKRILHHEGWNDPFDVPLVGWSNDRENVIDVLVENTDGPGGIGSTRFEMIDESTEVPTEAKPGFKDAGWRTVHLPHDYVIEGTFSKNLDAGHGALPTGTAWYRKSFNLPVSAKSKSV